METRELKAALWALAHFGTSVETVSILEDSGVLKSMVKLGKSCAVLSVRHTIFHCLCLICVTQPGAESLRKYDWFVMPRNHHESFPLWCLHNIAEKTNAALLKQIDMDFPNEAETDAIDADKVSVTSKTDSDSNILLEEDEEMQFLLVEETSDQVDSSTQQPGSSSQFAREIADSVTNEATKKALDNIPTRKISHAHHRSQSDSQALGFSSFSQVMNSPTKTSPGNGSGNKPKQQVTISPSSKSKGSATSEGIPVKQRTNSGSSSGGGGGAYGSFRGRVSSLFSGKSSSGVGSAPSQRSLSGSWKWRRRSRSDSASESVTSGVSSSESSNTVGYPHQSTLVHGGRSLGASSFVSEHVPTLSPIPSSASIATTVCSNPQSQNEAKMSPTSKGKRIITG